MLIDLREYDSAAGAVAADVCIVGAGPAGITIALELARTGIDVVLLEAGGRTYEDAEQELYRGQVVGHGNTDVLATRLRQFGGTSGHWTGLCAPLDPLDFEAREGVPHSGWPITRAELDPFYERAQPYLDLGPYDYSLKSWGPRLAQKPLPLDPGEVISAVYQLSPPTRFAEKYMRPVEDSQHIRCFLHANLTDIRLAEGSDTVTEVVASTLEGKRISVHARSYVIACGGIENARVLLNCRSQRPQGLGNEHDLVGRYFMDHLNTQTSLIVFADDTLNLDLYSGPVEAGSATLSVGLKLAPDVIRHKGLLNNTAFPVVKFENDAFSDDFRDHGWVSFATMVKAFSRGHVPDRLAENYCNAAEDVGTVALGLYRHVARRFLPAGKALAAELRQDAEQSPNPASRVTLTDDRDPLGWQRIALDWRIASSDLDSLRQTHAMIGAAIGAAGLGRLKLGLGDPPDQDIVYTAYHHMGTTRMHDDPRQGVVDRDCRVHSLKNLYMAGSSVFTTAGAANPTLTVVALAIRLAAKLTASLKS